MHHLQIHFLALFLFFITTASGQYNTENLTPLVDSEVQEQFNCEKLRLYPIMANDVFRRAHADVGRSVPMNKALQDGRLQVKEQNGGASVNTLQVINTSKDTIYLMQGEVVVGGQQDRMLAQDLLVPPGKTMDIGAFCVEQGRWSENGTGQGFERTAGVVSQDLRRAAAVDKEQSEVWEKVRTNLDRAGARSNTGSYMGMVNNTEHAAQRAAYRNKLLALPAAHKGMVGVIAVSGNKVIGCDVFANENMFNAAYPQLIDAYITEALNSGAQVSITAKELKDHFNSLFKDEEQLEQKMLGNGYRFQDGGRTYRISTF
ncbi:MAG: hypothetical protein M3R08_10170 [Bacteroidota bacterium]|nr:hypothetical protein [Bacteroidota bacterium]